MIVIGVYLGFFVELFRKVLSLQKIWIRVFSSSSSLGSASLGSASLGSAVTTSPVYFDYIYNWEDDSENSEDSCNYSVKEYWHIVDDSLGKWHIGLAIEITDNTSDDNVVLYVDVLMKPFAFFRFPTQTAKDFLVAIIEENEDVIVHAVHLENMTNTYGLYDLPESRLILKTHWIRIIQRRWKSIYIQRKQLLLRRGSIASQRCFELNGNYGTMSQCSVIGLRGMLAPLLLIKCH